MEFIDILNSDGSFSGSKASRKDIHDKGFWHAEIRVWIVNENNNILVQRRSFDKDVNPGMLSVSAGGHIDAGETPLVGAIRETEEEVGITFSKKDFILLDTVKLPESLPGWINNAFYYIYLVQTRNRISDFSVQKSEVAEIKYMSLEDIEKIIENNPKGIDIDFDEYELVKKHINNRK